MARQVAALKFPDLSPAVLNSVPPVLREVSPASLWIDDKYQRGLSERSIRLIRKIVAEWDWRAFKPPVVVDVEGQLQVIDGQHTAIAAVTHGSIETIPVMVVEADAQTDRAKAFVRHNRDRISVTPTQLHTAMVAAGDEDEMTVAQTCSRAGVRILRNPPALGRYQIGDTLAITTIRALVSRRHALGARKILETCVRGGMAPVTAASIRAVEYLLHADEYKGEIDAERISLVISANLTTLEEEAARFSTERKVPVWRAFASVIYMNRRKTRHAA